MDKITDYNGYVMLGDDIKKLGEPTTPRTFHHIDGSFVVECTKLGTAAMRIAHSCEPNCHIVPDVSTSTQKEHANQGMRVLKVVALHDIAKGEIITRDYAMNCAPKLIKVNKYDEKELKPCKCGSRNCRGFVDKVGIFDLSTDQGRQLIEKAPVVKWYKGRVEDYNDATFCPRRHDKTPHARMACDPVKQCQMCYYNRDEDNDTGAVCRCLVCNMYLCNKCYVKWHPKMEPRMMIATNANNTQFDVSIDSEREDFLDTLDIFRQHRKDVGHVKEEWIKICPQLSELNHVKFRNTKKCILCESKGYVSRCVQCFVDLCEDCWYKWHYNQNSFYSIDALRGCKPHCKRIKKRSNKNGHKSGTKKSKK